MRIYKQRNVYYLDLQKQVLEGYTELHVRRDYRENKISLKSSCLDIETVSIVSSAHTDIGVKYTAKGKPIEKELSNGFEVTIPKTFKLGCFILRIKFKRPSSQGLQKIQAKDKEERIEAIDDEIKRFKKDGDSCHRNNNYRRPGVLFYEPVGDEDTHREMVVENAAYACPFVDQVTNVEMIYILPNNRSIEIVSAGKFVSFTEEADSLIYVYEAKASNPETLLFALGTYHSQTLMDDGNVYTPSSFTTDLEEFTSDIQNILKFLNLYTDLSTPNYIFTMCPVEIASGRNFIVVNMSHIGRQRDIELNFKLKEILCETLTLQIFMFFNHAMVDSWIFVGLTGYLADMALRFLLGHNEFLYRQFEEKNFVVENDVIEPPLFYAARKKEEYEMRFFQVKSKLVFHAMHNQMSAAFIKKIIAAVIKLKQSELATEIQSYDESSPPVSDTGSTRSSGNVQVKISSPVLYGKSCLVAIQQKKSPKVKIQNETDLDNIISTDQCKVDEINTFTPFFIRIVKDSSGKDMKAFFDFHIFNPGVLTIDIDIKINSKKGIVSVEPRQKASSRIKTANSSYYSTVKLKSVETDGTFTQKIMLHSPTTYVIHKKTESSTVLFVRADCKRDVLSKIRLNQSETLYIEQLYDKSVTGQLEAIEFFRNNTSARAIEALERVAENPHTFHRVKGKIFSLLSQVYINNYDDQSVAYSGLMRLIQSFIKMRCVPNSTVVKSTETGIQHFLIQKALVKSISDFYTEENCENAPVISLNPFHSKEINPFTRKNINVTIAFLHNIINYNDTTKEHFDDPFYLANILNKLTVYKLALSDQLDHGLISEIERFRLLDMVFPSPHNLISKTCIICLIRIAYNHNVTLSYDFLRTLAQYPNYIDIRLIAIEGLLLFYVDRFDITQYIDNPLMVEGILRILIRMAEVGFKSIKYYHKENYDILVSIYCHYMNHRLGFLFETFLSRIMILEPEYVQSTIYEINYHLEKKQDIFIAVERCLGSRTIILRDFVKLRQLAFKPTLRFTLPLPKKQAVEEEGEIIDRKLLITLKYKRYKPISEFRGNIIRFNTGTVDIKYRNCDLPYLITKTLRESKSFPLIEKYLRGIKNSGKYDKDAAPLKKTEEEFTRERMIVTYLKSIKGTFYKDWVKQYHPNDNNFTINTFYRLESFLDTLYAQSFRFIFLYVPVNSKLYMAAKTLINAIDKILFTNSTIQKTVALIDDNTRLSCIDFVRRLIANEKYLHFIDDVELGEYKNYGDVVKYPMCLRKVLQRLESNSFDTEEDKSNIEKSTLTERSPLLDDQTESSSRDIIPYGSLDVLFYDLEKVALNCMLFNPKDHHLYHNAIMLKEEIAGFKDSLEFTEVDSKSVIEGIFRENDTKNFDLDVDIRAIRTWGDFDDEIGEIRKKYSRYSQNGKQLNEKLNRVKKVIEGYFYISGGKILRIKDV